MMQKTETRSTRHQTQTPSITSRERVRLALRHREPDRVPMDLGGTAVSTLREEGYAALLAYLGIPYRPPTFLSNAFRTVEIPEAVRSRFQVDFVGLRPVTPPTSRQIQHSPDTFTDEWGIRYGRPQGSESAFFPVQHPLAEADRDAIRRYRFPDMGDRARVEGLQEQAASIHTRTSYAIVADGMWSLLQRAYDLRGMDTFLIDLATDERTARTLLDRIVEATLGHIGVFLEEVGEHIDVVSIADDLGTQTGLIMSPGMYRQHVKRYHMAMIAEIRRHTEAKVLLHSDGAIYPLLPDLIEAGFDIINPVQTSARDMVTSKLKIEFGDDICFWGGVDTQTVLPHGTPQEVSEEVRRRIDDLAPGGGFVLGAVHNIQGDVPPENICALFETGLAHGAYRRSTDYVWHRAGLD